MAIDDKYGQVTLERGTIGVAEPVVVFRGQDALLPTLLGMYWELSAAAGSPQHHLDGIMTTIARVVAWQGKNRTQIPRSDVHE
jgi:hypothetical protein